VPPIRVLIADDHAVLRAGLRMLLEAQNDMQVAGETGDGSEVSQKARELKPDVVLLDLSMPGPPSGEVIREVLQACPNTRVLILTMHDDVAYLASALAAGAAGYVVKKVADSELLLAIRAVHAGRTFVDLTQTLRPPSRPFAERSGAERPPKELSRREREVLRLLARGQSKKQIARALVIAPGTVHTHTVHIYEKLGVSTRAGVALFAMEHGLLRA